MITAETAACQLANRADTRRADSRGPESGEPRVGIPGDSTVSLHVVRRLAEVVEQMGVSSRALLHAAQLAPDQLQGGDGRISRFEVYRLLELAMELTGDPGLGLYWAGRLSESTFAPISLLIAHAPTLRHGFAALAQFSRLLCDDIGFELVESEHTVTLRMQRMVGASAPMQRFCAEMMVASFFRHIREFSGHARSERVSFEYAAPEHHAEYTRVFGRAVQFGQPFTGITFDRAVLELPAPHKDEEVHAALRVLAERRLLRITQSTPYAVRVREFLVRQGGPLRADMGSAARAVGLSVRSLRRRLTAEGSPYQAVANEALMMVAKSLLLDRQHTIQEAAYALGFSDARTFHRAFRRATGTTPSAYRNAQLEELKSG